MTPHHRRTDGRPLEPLVTTTDVAADHWSSDTTDAGRTDGDRRRGTADDGDARAEGGSFSRSRRSPAGELTRERPSFPAPQRSFEDGRGHTIGLAAFGGWLAVEEFEPLVALYATVDEDERPPTVPTGGDRIRAWLEGRLTERHVNVLAWHGEAVVGHATLLSAAGTSHELATFVHPRYRGASVDEHLLAGVLGAGYRAGVTNVWLTPDRPGPSARLADRVGFEPVVEPGGGDAATLSMRLEL